MNHESVCMTLKGNKEFDLMVVLKLLNNPKLFKFVDQSKIWYVSKMENFDWNP